MFRLTTPEGFVLEFDNARDLLSAEASLRREREENRSGAKAVETMPETEPHDRAEKRGPPNSLDTVKRFTRTDGQRRLLQALAKADGPLTSEQLATELGMDKNRLLGTLGAIYANAGEQNVVPSEIVTREHRRGATGRRVYRYSAGPLLREA